jgi:hypothetical protein
MYGQNVQSDFVLNRSMPYVYLQFDHIGPRAPILPGEGTIGLYLRIVNNCRVPILATEFSTSLANDGVNLFDEIIPDPIKLDITVEHARRGAQKAKRIKHELPPLGYSDEISNMLRVYPGKDLLFSVPINHVGDDWFMRVQFALDVNDPSIGRGPYAYLDFYKGQIPKAALKKNPDAPDLSSPEGTILHESGHVDPPQQAGGLGSQPR